MVFWYYNKNFITGIVSIVMMYMICICCCCMKSCLKSIFNIDESNSNENRDQTDQTSPQGKTVQRKNDSLRRKLKQQFKMGFKGTFNRKRLKSLTANLTGKDNVVPDSTCSICFEDYQGDPKDIFIGHLKHCQHYFHFDCIWAWLELQGTCPLCRKGVELNETDIRGLALADVLPPEGTLLSITNEERKTKKARPSISTIYTVESVQNAVSAEASSSTQVYDSNDIHECIEASVVIMDDSVEYHTPETKNNSNILATVEMEDKTTARVTSAVHHNAVDENNQNANSLNQASSDDSVTVCIN